MLWEHCKSTIEAKGFVGLKRDNSGFNVYFPIGYSLPTEDRAAEQDIRVLLQVMGNYSRRLRINEAVIKKLVTDISLQGMVGAHPIVIAAVQTGFKHGVNYFAPIWERIVSSTFGGTPARQYYPECYWRIKRKKYKAGRLRPDCIAADEQNGAKQVVVIDAKYYRYGETKQVRDLPGASDIHKQITYGEYIAKKVDKAYRITNVFVLPGRVSTESKMEQIGIARGSWKRSRRGYEKVVAMLVDTKWLCERWINNGSID